MNVAGMEWGRQKGATLAVLEASTSGFPVYEGLGFKTTCETTVWVRLPKKLDRSGASHRSQAFWGTPIRTWCR
jgi:hypothetical protein